MSKKIVFNAIIIDDKPTGLGIYTKNVLKGILKYNRQIIKEIVCKDKNYLKDIDTKGIPIIQTRNLSKRINITGISSSIDSFFYKYRNNKDVIIYCPTQIYVPNVDDIQLIITIHDLIPILNNDSRYHKLIYYNSTLPKMIKKANKLIAISNHTKNDILNTYKEIAKEDIEVIYNGTEKVDYVNKEISKLYIKQKYGIENFVLMIGIHDEYKNLHSIIKAYSNVIKEKEKLKLVIVGHDNNPYARSLKKLAWELKVANDVIFLGYIREEDKNKLYQAAKIFMHPSKYEGFGLVVLEAMSNETLVVCSNKTSLPEIVGNAAILFNPNDQDEIEDKLLYVIENYDNINETYVKKGIDNVKLFNWDETSKKIIDTIKLI